MYDLVLENVRLVDPENGVDKVCNIAVEHGKIAEITEESLAQRCDTLIDMEGHVAVPGIIDPHTHLTKLFGGSYGGFRMLAKAGVCTALDLAGPSEEFFSTMKKHGSGINMATVESIRPGVNVDNNDPDMDVLHDFYAKSLEGGSLGCKLLGGHYPLTPEASARFVQAATDVNAYVCWHAGTTKNINTIESMRDMLDLAGKNRLHAAHINTYCRGFLKDEVVECQEAVEMLLAKPNVYSEAYLAQTNGISFQLDEEGHLKSKAAGFSLTKNGYENSEAGLVAALRSGFAHVFAPRGLETGVYYGEEAVQMLLESHCNISGGYDVNPPRARVLLCLATRKDGSFVVDAISTDGGAIPRNVIVSHGLSLVKMGMLSLENFVRKTSIMPATMLGLHGKGHLGVGADADISVLDLQRCEPVMTVASGKVCMYKGVVTGSEGTIITTERGRKTAESYGMPLTIVNPDDFLPARA